MEKTDESTALYRAMVARRVAIGALVAALLFAVSGVLYGVVVIRDTQLSGTPTGRKLLAAADRIQSCTTPGGKCNLENQRRTAKYLNQQARDTRDIVIATQVCSDQGIQGTGPLTACVDRALGTPKP